MNDKKEDLCIYRIRNAVETLGVAVLCLESQHYKDSINRSYYAAFYAIKAVLALEEIDFKRHKDAVAYFNKTYIAKEIFPREMGKRLGSDYDDFYVASLKDASDQYKSAKLIIEKIEEYLSEKGIQY